MYVHLCAEFPGIKLNVQACIETVFAAFAIVKNHIYLRYKFNKEKLLSSETCLNDPRQFSTSTLAFVKASFECKIFPNTNASLSMAFFLKKIFDENGSLKQNQICIQFVFKY